MPIIKATRSDEITRSALVLDLGDLNRQAAAIIAAGRQEAERIVAAASAEAQRLVDTADARGFAAGQERGLRDGRVEGRTQGREDARRGHEEELQQLIDAWSEALTRWESESGRMLLAAREDVLRFALAMARKIVGRVTALDPGVVETQLTEVLELLSRPSAVRITVHPDDRPRLEATVPALVERIAACTHASIDTDAGLSRGGCIVRTEKGVIDATIETQIERIVETLLPDPAEPAPPAGAEAPP